ncbi:MAG: FliI/YscN family ATPase [Proteobacteria bacterium]|nr:FliI/YscN family ATPase [Pseudomonadota bacterium]
MTMDYRINWDKYIHAVDTCLSIQLEGRVVKVVGLIVEASGLNTGVGSLCSIHTDNNDVLMAEVVGFREDRVLLMPYGDVRGIRAGSRIVLLEKGPEAEVGDGYLGRVIDGMGHPIDGGGPIMPDARYPLYGKPINPMQRRAITQLMDVGVSAINTMIPLGRGQRVAIMAGSGVGKSVLMGMMAKHTDADVTVIGLVGERGREVKDFVENNLGPKGLKKSVVVAATSDMPPLVRMRGAYVATALAEYFRDQGKNVLLIIDSITRFAMSSRDVGLSAGEPPTNRGYTSSFFVRIPILLERAGNLEGKGSITGIYTVLVEGDDLNDPVGDTVRSIVDGHIVLSRKLANRGHYPAIEVLESVSRVARDVAGPEHLGLREKTVKILSAYAESEDMITIGAYAKGSNPVIDQAIVLKPKLDEVLRQPMDRQDSYEVALNKLKAVYLS